MTTLTTRSLRLTSACRLVCTGDTITVSTREQDIDIRSDCPEIVKNILVGLSVGGCPRELAHKNTINPEVLEPILSMLLEDDLLLDINCAADAKDTTELVQALRAEARFWARPIFEQSFWTELLEGRCTRAQVLGWGMEFHHFVDAANIYMPLGVAHTRHVHCVRESITRHYIEEMDHAIIFQDGLVGCGVNRKSILASRPLPHTSALINQLVEFAYEGEITYTAAFAVMQPGFSSASMEALNHFYGHLTELYPYATSMFDAFHRHAALDLDLAHEEAVFYRLCKEVGLSYEQRKLASETMQTVAEAFILFFEGISEEYDQNELFVPRRPMYIESYV